MRYPRSGDAESGFFQAICTELAALLAESIACQPTVVNAGWKTTGVNGVHQLGVQAFVDATQHLLRCDCVHAGVLVGTLGQVAKVTRHTGQRSLQDCLRATIGADPHRVGRAEDGHQRLAQSNGQVHGSTVVSQAHGGTVHQSHQLRDPRLTGQVKSLGHPRMHSLTYFRVPR
jgi:hypothetical protein